MIRIHSLATAEIEEAFIWYLKHSSRVEPDDLINVYAVMHESREPGYWQNRNL